MQLCKHLALHTYGASMLLPNCLSRNKYSFQSLRAWQFRATTKWWPLQMLQVSLTRWFMLALGGSACKAISGSKRMWLADESMGRCSAALRMF